VILSASKAIERLASTRTVVRVDKMPAIAQTNSQRTTLFETTNSPVRQLYVEDHPRFVSQIAPTFDLQRPFSQQDIFFYFSLRSDRHSHNPLPINALWCAALAKIFVIGAVLRAAFSARFVAFPALHTLTFLPALMMAPAPVATVILKLGAFR
jgi:hypothetical protein